MRSGVSCFLLLFYIFSGSGGELGVSESAVVAVTLTSALFWKGRLSKSELLSGCVMSNLFPPSMMSEMLLMLSLSSFYFLSLMYSLMLTIVISASS